MTWKMTERAQAAPDRKTYRCLDCGHQFRWVHTGEPGDDPECPECPKALVGAEPAAAPQWVPPRIAIGTTKGRAIDYVQGMVETDFGMSDMNDNQRAGDIAFKGPAPLQTAERQATIRDLVEAGVPEATSVQIVEGAKNYWQGQSGAPSTEATLGQASPAAAGSAAARREGVEPLGMLEADRKRVAGAPNRGYNVVASDPDMKL